MTDAALDKALMETIQELVDLEVAIIACETPEDFAILRSRVKASFDEDAAATKATVNRALAIIKKRNLTIEAAQ